MSRWFDKDIDDSHFNVYDEEKESHLLGKFYDYVKFEKNEIDKRKKIEKLEKGKLGLWTNRFMFSAIIHVSIVTGFVFSLILIQFLSQTNLIDFFLQSINVPLQWLFLGYVLYMIVVVSLTITGIFYNHIEKSNNNQIIGLKKKLAYFHLFGMSIAGPASALMMIFAGMIGSGMIIPGVDGQNEKNLQIMDMLNFPINVSFSIFVLGILVGGGMFFSTFMNRFKSDSKEYSKLEELDKQFLNFPEDDVNKPSEFDLGYPSEFDDLR